MRRPTGRRLKAAVAAVLAGQTLLVAAEPAAARSDRDEQKKLAQSVSKPTVPLKLVVSIRNQRISVWEGVRKIAEAPISSGKVGHSTPTGVFSILEKNKVHFSNLYDNAPMPFMQRITWSGVALHAGALPGYPASHGCIRLPYSFARQLFDMTRIGARVIVARDGVEPQVISHAKLLVPLPPAEQVANAAGAAGGVELLLGVGTANAASMVKAAYTPRRTRASVAAERAAELSALQDAITKAEAERAAAETLARVAAGTARDAAAELDAARKARAAVLRALDGAEKARQMAERELATFVSRHVRTVEQLEDDRLEALGVAEDELEGRIQAGAFEIEDIEAELADGAAEIDRLASVAAAAEGRRADAASDLVRRTEAVKQAQADKTTAERLLQRRSLPITAFISRKTGKLHVRQGFEPLFEAQVAIDQPDAPLGTHVFTALEFEPGERSLAWTAVSLPGTADARPRETRSSGVGAARPAGAPPSTTAAGALDRVRIPDDVLERLAEYVRPGSSLVISDLDMSNETGKGTDFILLTRQ